MFKEQIISDIEKDGESVHLVSTINGSVQAEALVKAGVAIGNVQVDVKPYVKHNVHYVKFVFTRIK